MPTLTNEELIDIFIHQLPTILDERPELEPQLYHIFLKTFARKEEVAAVRQEIEDFRAETRTNFEQADQRLTEFQAETQTNFEQVDQHFEQVDQRFEQVDQRFEQVDQRFEQVDQRFEQVNDELKGIRTEIKGVVSQIDRLGSRWGIRNEEIFRATITSLLEESFGVTVETRHIKGEQFDIIISNGQHILVEITASVGRKIHQRLERKRDLYTQETGKKPARFILATASIHSRRAEALREAGFEVIEPEEDESEE